MPLKTVVKVGNISNLSDARYCSGMGVDMLGFRVIEGQDHYVSTKLFQEIRGWVTGPKIVAEIYGISSANDLDAIVENYAPDYFELSDSEYERLKDKLTLPCIVAGTVAESANIVFMLVDEGNLQAGEGMSRILVRPSSGKNVLDLIELPIVAGLALNGSTEERPGFKDYSELADILEKLDDY